MTSPDDLGASSKDPGEDPLALFPSENQRAIAIGRTRLLRTVAVWSALVTAAWLRTLRFVAVSYASASSSLPAVHARLALALSQCRGLARRLAARESMTTIAVGAFAFGVVVGGSVMWLSGASRHEVTQTVALQQMQHEGSLIAAQRGVAARTEPPATPVDQYAARSKPAATRSSARPPGPLFRGSLIVDSRPSGAQVFLNGMSVGTTPLVLRNQPAGSRAVKVALDGYESWSSAVQVVANTRTRLRAELKAQRKP